MAHARIIPVFNRINVTLGDMKPANRVPNIVIAVLYIKVMEMLAHINKRLRSRALVQLPVDDLIAQYTNQETPAFVSVRSSYFVFVDCKTLSTYRFIFGTGNALFHGSVTVCNVILEFHGDLPEDGLSQTRAFQETSAYA